MGSSLLDREGADVTLDLPPAGAGGGNRPLLFDRPIARLFHPQSLAHNRSQPMPYKLGEKSRAKLAGVHADLIRVVLRAIEITKVDFAVHEGVRTPERQRQLYAQGRTQPGKKVTWTLNSNHFINPKTGKGHAVDLLPAPYDWKEGPQWQLVADAMFAAAKELGIKIRWGRDWDMDGIPMEAGEYDGPHFELVR